MQLATFIQMKAEEYQKREERWKAEKDLEEQKLLWDQEHTTRNLLIYDEFFVTF